MIFEHLISDANYSDNIAIFESDLADIIGTHEFIEAASYELGLHISTDPEHWSRTAWIWSQNKWPNREGRAEGGFPLGSAIGLTEGG